MNVNDEYKWISHTFKGEVWEEAKKSLINDFGFIEVEGQHFKSPDTGVVYRFVLRRDTYLFITRIDTMSDNRYAPIEYSVSDRINTLQRIEDGKKENKKTEREIREELEFQFNLKSTADLINDYWGYKQRQNSKYRKNTEIIDRTIKFFTDIGFDFSREISVLDALMIGDDYCVLETTRRSNGKNLKRIIKANERYHYLYKAKPDDGLRCLYSGILVQKMFGMELFIKLHIEDEDGE